MRPAGRLCKVAGYSHSTLIWVRFCFLIRCLGLHVSVVVKLKSCLAGDHFEAGHCAGHPRHGSHFVSCSTQQALGGPIACSRSETARCTAERQMLTNMTTLLCSHIVVVSTLPGPVLRQGRPARHCQHIPAPAVCRICRTATAIRPHGEHVMTPVLYRPYQGRAPMGSLCRSAASGLEECHLTPTKVYVVC